MSKPVLTVTSIKAQAKRLKAQLDASGETISHSHSLELLALHHGYKDWNTFSAALKQQSLPPVAVGEKVEGHYLEHPISATVVAVYPLEPGLFRIQLKLEEAVDVATSQLFSAWRKQIHAVIDCAGMTAETTLNGEPHLRLALQSNLPDDPAT
ncbi:MAG: glyoxalase superfamily protein [Saccharospirillum sp.]|uniref:glyoxalase superfamily protein n=1 Tax=Saccharospirillum sp. TaxID=2033801 RepID=UPI00329A7650